jgi:hypothetical protein
MLNVSFCIISVKRLSEGTGFLLLTARKYNLKFGCYRFPLFYAGIFFVGLVLMVAGNRPDVRL